MKLFEPITINGMSVRNRILMPAMQLNLGLANRRARGYFRERARGGAGALSTAAVRVDIFACDELWEEEGGVKGFLKRLEPLIETVHQEGAKLGVQLSHGNRYPTGRDMSDTSGEPVAPSAKDDMRELTVAEIEDIVSRYAAAAARVREAGFDYVEIHGAHHQLMRQFFSGADNHRSDDYGGDVTRRMRFGLETVRAVRKALGPDFPLFFRLAAQEKRPEGITLEESTPYAMELEKCGVDALNVSIGPGDPPPSAPTKKYPYGIFVPLAAAIKEKVNIPVIAVGRLHKSEVAERALLEGKADMVAIGRQLLADPFWPEKVRQGREEEIVYCDACNRNCYGPIGRSKVPPNSPICRLNERVGREWEA